MAMFCTLKNSTKNIPSLTLIFLLFFSPIAASAGSYADSAHGNTGYGVERTAAWAGSYAQGNCAHCHEQHTAEANGYLLLANSFSGQDGNPYDTSSTACFACHVVGGSLQTDGITNNDFSATFGGATASTNSILAAFNQTSYHNLYDVQRYITGLKGTKSFANFPAGSNPCSGCHNVHLAKANKRDTDNPLYTAISKPSDHNNLWGDDTPGERMTSINYGTSYQPPNYYSSGLEPDGGSVKTTQAEATPDYITFCTDCHNADNFIYSTKAVRYLKRFNWDLEQHGAGAAENWAAEAEILSPYSDASLGSYTLSCMDCHEPHGSENSYLIRTSVNSGSVYLPASVDDDIQDWDHLCSRCHIATGSSNAMKKFHHNLTGFVCLDCHFTKPPTGDPITKNCITCHYHSSTTGGYKTF